MLVYVCVCVCVCLCVDVYLCVFAVENGLKHNHLGAKGMGTAQMTFRFFTALLYTGNLIPLSCAMTGRGGDEQNENAIVLCKYSRH